MEVALFENPNGTLVRAGAGLGHCRAFVPNVLPPTIDWTNDVVALVSASDRALGELRNVGRMLPNPRLLMAPFMRREAVLSSRIEGTQATIKDLYLFEAVQTANVEISDVLEVHNYVAAIDLGLEAVRTLPLSRRLLRDLHRRLMIGVRGQERRLGEFRKVQNWIGPLRCAIEEATYVPPPPSHMDQALDDLEKYFHTPSGLPPLVRQAIIHYQFEAIHPFEDGNGRVGRLLIVLALCMEGFLPGPLLYISDYFERRRTEYYERLLAVSTRSRWSDWIEFFLRAATDAARDGTIRAQRLIDLQTDFRTRTAGKSPPPALLLDKIFIFPPLTTAVAAERSEKRRGGEEGRSRWAPDH